MTFWMTVLAVLVGSLIWGGAVWFGLTLLGVGASRLAEEGA